MEQKEELIEFDESVPLTAEDEDGNVTTVMEATTINGQTLTQLEETLSQLTKELKPIEQYALKFMEKLRENLDTEALEAAEEDITIAKEEWELTHMQALKEEEELRAEVEEDEMYYTTEARCRQAANSKKQGAEFFASLGEGGRGMHAGPMRACRY